MQEATIGTLSRRTGIPIKTIRYYSEIGLVPESSRSHSGYRRYDGSAEIRLALVRTLRDLGLDLSTIRSILDRHADLPGVAAAQVDAIDAQIRVLRLRRAVLRRLTIGTPTDKEVERVHRLAHASAEERRRIMNDFLDQSFAGLDIDPEFEARFRTAMPDLPDDPTDEQVDAWVELAELVQDPDFRASVRRMSEASWGTTSGTAGESGTPDPASADRMIAVLDRRVTPLVEAGVDPTAPAAAPVLDELIATVAAGRPDSTEFRRDLASRWESGLDARAERYWQLLATVNGWPPIPTRTPSFAWAVAAVRAHPPTHA